MIHMHSHPTCATAWIIKYGASLVIPAGIMEKKERIQFVFQTVFTNTIQIQGNWNICQIHRTIHGVWDSQKNLMCLYLPPTIHILRSLECLRDFLIRQGSWKQACKNWMPTMTCVLLPKTSDKWMFMVVSLQQQVIVYIQQEHFRNHTGIKSVL